MLTKRPQDAVCYRFRDLIIDPGQRRLTRGRVPLRISKLTFDFLVVLVEAWPRVVAYEELVDKVWGGRYASPETVSQRVSMVRKALSDQADHPRYLEVVRGHGCKLLPAVEVVAPRWRFSRPREAVSAMAGGIAMIVITSLYWTYSGSSVAPPQPTFDDRLVALPRGNPELRELYGRALDYWRNSGERSVRLSYTDPGMKTYLDRIIEIEPGFAMAHAQMARGYADGLIETFGVAGERAMIRRDQERLTHQYAEQALALDPSNAVAHLANAKVHQHKWEWTEARAAYYRALDADPDHLGILHATARFHGYVGEHAQAVALAERAADYDRSNAVSYFHLGLVHAFAGNTDAAADALAGAVALDPAYAAAHVWRGAMEILRGNHDAALRAARTAEPIILQGYPPRVLWLAHLYARLGLDEDVGRLMEVFYGTAERFHFGAGSWAMAHLSMGDADAALDALRLAAGDLTPDDGFAALMVIKANVFENEILSEPEFVALRSQLGATD